MQPGVMGHVPPSAQQGRWLQIMILATWHGLILCGECLTVTACLEGEWKLNIGCKTFGISASPCSCAVGHCCHWLRVHSKCEGKKIILFQLTFDYTLILFQQECLSDSFHFHWA
jgi:hypothetical protein